MHKKITLKELTETLLLIVKAGILNSGAIPPEKRVGIDAQNLTLIWDKDSIPVKVDVQPREVKYGVTQTGSEYSIRPHNKGYRIFIRTAAGLPEDRQLATLESLFQDDGILEELRENPQFTKIRGIQELEHSKEKIPTVNYNQDRASIDIELKETLLRRAVGEYRELKRGKRKISNCETINDLGNTFYDYVIRRSFLAFGFHFKTHRDIIERHRELPRGECYKF